MIRTLLIANRGEIACRIIATARARGLRTVAVYSDVDRDALHVRMADDAVRIGPAPVAESYLSADAILDAARTSGADAIHPGYGFLSENAAFAQAVAEAGLIFVGAPVAAIRAMGNKAEAKRLMIAAGVPCVPGYHGTDQTNAALLAAAEDIGWPVMIKAAAGGGGRGMRRVRDGTGFAEALDQARSEARNAFGSDELILEHAVENARHVEVQVFADAHGTTLHMGERDCSVQRRHQKVIEEAPCPVITPEIRAAMTRAAVDAARAVEYRGAGTVEFLLGAEGAFYFLEMNTRLQVEHPVTEAVTGLDLVTLQISVAEGSPLPVAQDDITLTGHAIEARLYAEDPARNYLPTTGYVAHWHLPSDDGIRVDTGIDSGTGITPHYDPMLAKIVASGPTRDIARQRLIRALGHTRLLGPVTNRAFLQQILSHPDFASGSTTTGFLTQHWPEGDQPAPPTPTQIAIAAALFHRHEQDRWFRASMSASSELLGWSSIPAIACPIDLLHDTRTINTEVAANGPRLDITIAGHETPLSVEIARLAPPMAEIIVDGIRSTVAYAISAEARLCLSFDGCDLHLTRPSPNRDADTDDDAGYTIIHAPMPGMIIAVQTTPGAAIRAGDTLATVEAMKMQHPVTAPRDGIVETVHATTGSQIAAGDPILTLRPKTQD